MILKIGSRGKEVKTLQEFFSITADGIFGKGTELTVKKWQMDNGLVSDGIVGPKTNIIYQEVNIKQDLQIRSLFLSTTQQDGKIHIRQLIVGVEILEVQ